MGSFGVRDLRQNASEILREVESGEAATITVAGRAVAQIVPLRAERWTTWSQVCDIYASPTDAQWDEERRSFGQEALADPWSH